MADGGDRGGAGAGRQDPGDASKDRRCRRRRSTRPARHRRGPEAENDRRYLLSSKRVLNQSIGKFLNARTMSEHGALDYVDLDPIDPFNPDKPHDSEARPTAILPGNVVDSQDIEAEFNGLDRGENTEQQLPDSAPLVVVSAKTPAPTLSAKASCDDDQILRNEAIEFVRGPWSVVRCEIKTSVEPGVASPAHKENPCMNQFPRPPLSFMRARPRHSGRANLRASRVPTPARTNPRPPLIDLREKRAPRGDWKPVTQSGTLEAIIGEIFDAHRPREPRS